MTTPPASTTTYPTHRLGADERRELIVSAAMTEFAQGGYAGTPVEAIARRVGVSQPYIFALFGTKKDLFIAVVREGFGRARRHFHDVGEGARLERPQWRFILEILGCSYGDLIAEDRDLLLIQLHAYAACADPEIRDVVREEYGRLYQEVAQVSGADDTALREWFSQGMLCNVIAAMGLSGPEAFSVDGFSASGGAANRP